ncbi:hypothetical protein [Verrucosispora sp. TAA-831]|uniref:hypothetical protein n=1 Tax=Verrucosispora sp. TAA-831 TaxID=3422227 RepID=UPI003D6F11F4
MSRHRARRRARQPAVSRLTHHGYQPDPATPDSTDPDHPLCRCGLARTHPRHEPPDTSDAQAEHLRRIGDDQ